METLVVLSLLIAFCLAATSSSRPGRSVPKGRLDVDYTMDVPTSHVKWGNPLEGGPIRAYLAPNVVAGRDVVELAQRLSLEYDALTLETGGHNSWGFGDFYGERGGTYGRGYERDFQYLVEDLTADTPYQVIVIPGTHGWHELPQEARSALLERVRAGAGLVLVAPAGDPSRLAELEELSPLLPTGDTGSPVQGEPWQATAPHYITTGVPLHLLPFDQMSRLPYEVRGEALIEAGEGAILAVRTCGRGRVAAFGYQNFCFSPLLANSWLVDKAYPYWEYYYSLLSRAIMWAAQREPGVRLSAIHAGVEAVTVEFEGEARPVTVEVTVRDERYQRQEVLRQEVAQCSSAQLPISADLNGGLLIADVAVKGSEGVIDWGTATADVPRDVSVEDIKLASEVVSVGDKASGEAVLRAESPTVVSLALRFEDNYGRVLDRAEHEVEVRGEVRHPFALSTGHCLTRLGRVVCSVHRAARTLDQRTASLFVRIPQIWDDYEIIMDRFLPEPAPGRWSAIAGQLEEMNVSVMGAISASMSEHMNFKIQADVVAYGFHPRYYEKQWNENRKSYLETRDKKYLVRNPCFTDPAYREEFRARLKADVGTFARFSPVSYYAYEEPSLTHFGGAFDLCWSPTCLAGFVDWLRETYGTLEALNAEWGTKYSSWGDILPLTCEEAQQKDNYPPWADFRTWMEMMYADVYREGHKIIRAIDPNAVVCLSGNQVGNPFNGYDYSRINHYVDQMQLYTGQNLDEINRSFYPGMRCTGCTGYGVSDPDLSLQLWGRLLNGDTAGCVIFWEISCLNPDLTFCKSGADLARHFGELRGGGIARLLSAAERENCGIAIHYSYPSFHGTWITDGEIVDHAWSNRSSKAFDLFSQSRIAWTHALEGLGYQYDFISYSQLEEGALANSGYRLLILPDSVAVSDKEAEAIRQFVAAGGIVIADVWPAVMDEHCKWRDGGGLDDLFGIAHGRLEPSDFQRAEAGARVRVTEGETGWCAGHDAVVRRPHGKGRAYYLGASLAPIVSDRDAGHRERVAGHIDLVSKLLGEIGLKPPAQVVGGQGGPALTCESVHYHAGAADYFGIVRYPGAPEEKVELSEESGVPGLEGLRADIADEGSGVRVQFAEARHVYDVRAHRYLGYTDAIEADLTYGDAGIYARLPYLVERLDVSASQTVAPGQAVTFKVALSVSGEGAIGDHVATIAVYGPDGRECRAYSSRLVLPGGSGIGSIPLALSDAAGEWRITARDVASGVEGSASFTVAEQ